jgi:hypothetical protein
MKTGAWSEDRPLRLFPDAPHIWTADMAVSPDESYMIFTTTRPGDYGGGDLYVSFRGADGYWGEPINLGPEVNSECLSTAPWLRQTVNTCSSRAASATRRTVAGQMLPRAMCTGSTWRLCIVSGRMIKTRSGNMFRYFRIIRKKLIEQDNVRKYLLYAIGEVLLVVIGILIALQINNWNEDKQAKIRMLTNIISIQDDIQVEIQILGNVIQTLHSQVESAGASCR